MKNKVPSEITAEDLPEINAILARENTVHIIPGPNGSAKIIDIRRKVVKHVQRKDCTAG